MTTAVGGQGVRGQAVGAQDSSSALTWPDWTWAM